MPDESSVIDRRKECRRRNVYFCAPQSVPLSTNLRLVQNDPSTLSLEDVASKHCEDLGEDNITPLLAYIEKLKAVSKPGDTVCHSFEVLACADVRFSRLRRPV